MPEVFQPETSTDSNAAQLENIPLIPPLVPFGEYMFDTSNEDKFKVVRLSQKANMLCMDRALEVFQLERSNVVRFRQS